MFSSWSPPPHGGSLAAAAHGIPNSLSGILAQLIAPKSFGLHSKTPSRKGPWHAAAPSLVASRPVRACTRLSSS